MFFVGGCLVAQGEEGSEFEFGSEVGPVVCLLKRKVDLATLERIHNGEVSLVVLICMICSSLVVCLRVGLCL